MKKETPFLDFYYRCIESKSIRDEVLPSSKFSGGLCSTVLNKHTVFIGLKRDAVGMDFWGFGHYEWFYSVESLRYDFTPLRQNIVLLCAAINGEL